MTCDLFVPDYVPDPDALENILIAQVHRSWQIYCERAIMRDELLSGTNAEKHEANKKRLWMRQLKIVD